MRLEGKVAVVTGGNSGIGLGIAEEFKAEGARVVIFGRNVETLEQAREGLGGEALTVQGDVGNLLDLDRLFAETVSRFGPIDVVVANAGIFEPKPLEEVDEAVFDRTTAINFKGAFFTVQRAIGHMRDGGSVILVTSTANQAGVPGLSVYSATKAALRSLARSMSAELLPRGIRVNALSPGAIATPIFERAGFGPEEVTAMTQAMGEQIPMRRFGEPREIGRAAVFLASGDSSYMAGAELVVGGGLSEI